ncbi:MAG: glycosyltransferase [Anaerococcus prevotii]|uniref:glycosyltransferase n=1 Tax=Anaerococcus prevotii TaxID=33034 RepID=UPI0023F55EE1|nr:MULTISPECIES: glycosyltransferase [Peptoniphilaceae]MDU2558465.1 glycosyltransferase [Anaerococcus prevotii]
MILVLVSDFMQDEIYLKEEIKYYKNVDQAIIFTVRGHIYSNSRLQIPDYIQVGELDIFYKSNFDRIKYLLKGLFDKEFFREIKYLIKERKFSLNSVKNLCLFVAKGALVNKKIAKKLEELEIDKKEKIVFYTYRVGFSSLACCELKNIYINSKVVTRAHAQDIFEFRDKHCYLPYRHYLYSNIDEIYCISNDGMNYLYKTRKELKNKLFLHRLGTKDIAINNSINNENFVILTCSRIAKIKRLHLLAKTLEKINDTEITWIHYGDGDKEYLELINKYVKNCGKNIHIEFKGFCDNDEYLKKISMEHYSVFVNISESEGLPVSIMEAESVGIPIIATDVGGTSEAVVDGYNGILIDRDFSIRDLQDSILKFKSMDKNEFNVYRMNSRKIWESRFKLSENYNKFIDHIKEL